MQSRKGLTLIELLIVVIILGALAAIAIPRITTSTTTAKNTACQTNVDTLNTAMEMYNIDNGTYPALAVLTADANYFPDGAPSCPYGSAFPYALKADGSNRIQTHGH